MSAFYRFPELQLPSGRWIRIEMFTQDVSSGISAPYNNPANRIDLTVNPWLQGGIPMARQVASPIIGIIGTDAMDFSFCGIDVYGGKSLFTLIMEQPPDQYVWNIRYYTRPDSGSYSLRPQFWGIVKTTVVDGDLLSVTDHRLNKYKLTAVNLLELLDRVEIGDWSIDWKNAPLEIAPANIYIDGLRLNTVMFSDTGSEAWIQPDSLRFMNIRDMFETMAAAMALTTTINKIDSVLSSWVFYGKDSLGVESAYTFDELVIATGMEVSGHPIFGSGWFWHYSYFDHEKNGQYSIYNNNSVLQVLKQFLVPFGLTAFIDSWHQNGENFLAIREADSRAGFVLRKLLREKTLSPGENATRGITANVAEDGELSINGTDGEQFDCCFQSATRLRAGDKWTHTRGGVVDQNTGDLHCLFGSLYIYDVSGNYVTNVTKIDVKSDGRGARTVTPASVTMNLGGKMVAEAAARYYFNNQNTTVSLLGMYRRVMQELECRAFEIRDAILGVTTSFATGKLVCTGKFTEDDDTYLYRRVRNANSGEETVITHKDSDDVLALADDIFPSTYNIPFVILEPRVGDFAEDAAGNRWRIIRLAVNDREGTTDFLLEREGYG